MLTFIITLLIAGIFIALIIGSIAKKPIADHLHSTPSDIYKDKTLKNDTINFDDSETMVGKYLIVDTETTGLPKSKYYPIEDSDSWPFILQIAWIILDKDLKFVESFDGYLDYKGEIPYEATRINNIDKAKIKAYGQPTQEVLSKFIQATKNTEFIVAHNIDFDVPIILAELYRNNLDNSVKNLPTICTMNTTVDFVGAINKSGYPKKPRLEELYLKCFYGSIYAGTVENKHNAYNDMMMTATCFRYLIENSVLTPEGKIYKTPKPRQAKVKSDPISYIRNVDIQSVFDKDISIDNLFLSKKVVITGVFYGFTRDDLHVLLQKLGAELTQSLSSKTQFCIMGHSAGLSKLEKIEDLKLKGSSLKVVTESEFLNMINGIIISNSETPSKRFQQSIQCDNGSFHYITKSMPKN